MPRLPAILLSLFLGAAVHIDWHIARPAHHRLSLGLELHWAITAAVFGVVGCLIARFWPRDRWTLGAMVFVAAIVLGQGIEPLLTSLIFEGRLGYDVPPARWTAFFQSIVAAIPAYFGSLWLCVRREPARAG